MIEDITIGSALDLAQLREAIVALSATAIGDVADGRLGGERLTPASAAAEAMDRVAALEAVKAACAQAQAQETLAAEAARRQQEAEDPSWRGKRRQSIVGEVALARRVSPSRAARLVSFAQTLENDLPRIAEAMRTGDGTEEQALAVAREVEHLEPEQRRKVDEAVVDGLQCWGIRQVADEAKAHALRLDPDSGSEREEAVARSRRVTMRRSPDASMAYVTALVPFAEAATAFSTLRTEAIRAHSAGEVGDRGLGEVMADTLLQRVTGQSEPARQPIEVQLIMSQDTLIGGDNTPGWVAGLGPVSAEKSRRMVAEHEKVFLRRLFTDPGNGALVGMESRRREFTGLLRQMIVFRDDRCRTPYCDAPIRHIDHAHPYRSGGETSWENASGLCATCNYTKENPGWRHAATAEKLTVTTPTGHEYVTPTGRFQHGAAPGADPPGGTDCGDDGVNAPPSPGAMPGPGMIPDPGVTAEAPAATRESESSAPEPAPDRTLASTNFGSPDSGAPVDDALDKDAVDRDALNTDAERGEEKGVESAVGYARPRRASVMPDVLPPTVFRGSFRDLYRMVIGGGTLKKPTPDPADADADADAGVAPDADASSDAAASPDADAAQDAADSTEDPEETSEGDSDASVIEIALRKMLAA